MIDDELDPLLRDAAQSYHLPPEPPREAMWEAITRARAASSVTPITGGRQTPRWLVAAAGLAAVLLVGIAIGRASRGSDTPATIANSSPNPGNTEAAAPPIATAAGPSGESVPPKLQVADARLSPNAAERRAARDAANTAIDVASDQSAYRMAVVEHLARTEVLLIGFRAQSHSGGDARVDAQFTDGADK